MTVLRRQVEFTVESGRPGQSKRLPRDVRFVPEAVTQSRFPTLNKRINLSPFPFQRICPEKQYQADYESEINCSSAKPCQLRKQHSSGYVGATPQPASSIIFISKMIYDNCEEKDK